MIKRILIRPRRYLVGRANIRSRRTIGSFLSIRLSSAFPMAECLTLRFSPFAGEAKIAVEDIRHHFGGWSEDHLPHCRNGGRFAIYTLRPVPLPILGVTGDLIITRKGVSSIRHLFAFPPIRQSFSESVNVVCKTLYMLLF